MTALRPPGGASRIDRVRVAVELVAASALAVTHVAGAIAALAAVRHRTGRCR